MLKAKCIISLCRRDHGIEKYERYRIGQLPVYRFGAVDQEQKHIGRHDKAWGFQLRINRTISKAVTQCGCIRVNAKKQEYPEDVEFDNINGVLDSHVEGHLCSSCRDLLEKDIGRHLFYLTSICNTLDLNLYDIIIKELDRLQMLGRYSLR